MKVEFIVNKKSRNTTFKRRKEGLVKKIKELSTLCDVDACMIIYSPDHDAPPHPILFGLPTIPTKFIE
ncbi:mads-box transcription factor pheres 2 [Phtheirospermum japonicum]|uniref:Mads-box transcription factor pheres 2 n=1 Tax=Phtheirospermum japonicum TaxID=374723 RepID=A0A830DII8_9LAMI|nr:mads-box transcription factor pheres 2 [Phtheirospermum japonicum]